MMRVTCSAGRAVALQHRLHVEIDGHWACRYVTPMDWSVNVPSSVTLRTPSRLDRQTVRLTAGLRGQAALTPAASLRT